MKKTILAFSLFSFMVGIEQVSAQKKNVRPVRKTTAVKKTSAGKTVLFKNYNDSLSYALGFSLGRMADQQLGINENQVNYSLLTNAFKEALKKEGHPLISDSASNKMLNELAMRQYQKQREEEEKKADSIAKPQLEAGEKFLSENKTKEGVVSLPSGLQYKIIKEGTGEKPTDTSRVTVHYKGTLLDGTIFDSSIDRGQPVTFGVHQVIPGWTEALKLMPVGSKWILYIPSKLAYGNRQAGAQIKPGSTLIFEVELLSIEK